MRIREAPADFLAIPKNQCRKEAVDPAMPPVPGEDKS
jgi:hypothetical protein